MRPLIGLLYALGGAVAGSVAGVAAAMLFAKVTNASNREGAVGYFAIAIGIIGGIIGLGVGIWRFTRSAPAGQGGTYGGSAVLGVLAAVAAVAFFIWLRLYTMECPVEYDGAQANLELELRLATADFPPDFTAYWVNIEVQTSSTRPVGTILTSDIRREGEHTIIPVVQGPLYRAVGRVIVVDIKDRQTEVFTPPMKRVPDSRADWSPWYRPQRVDPPYGVEPKEALRPLFELRWRVRRYGE